ncbi:serine/threonine-protein kinase HAL4/sat4 [Podila epigama]|nr:serine/threonine-protein kinase HAL4/sat4 [Podila epigama]
MVTFSTDYWAPAMEANVRRRPQEKSVLHSEAISHRNNEGSLWNTLRQVPTIDDTTSRRHFAAADSNSRPRRRSIGNVLSSSLWSTAQMHNSQPDSSSSPSPSSSSSSSPSPPPPSSSSTSALNHQSPATSTPPVSSSSTGKRHSLIHKFFYPNESKSNSQQQHQQQQQHQHYSPPQSPAIVEDPYLNSSISAGLDRKNLFNVKAHVLGRGGFSSSGSERSDSRGPNGVMGGILGPHPDCSLLKKYGLCDKGHIGQGATAIVRLAHKRSNDAIGGNGNHASNAADMNNNNNAGDPDAVTEKLFAVKEFRKRRKDETEKEYIKKLTSEFCISSTLQHENVVQTVDLVQDEHHHWCEVMEYCRGGDLYNAIKQGHMSRTEIDCCFKQLIHGVAYLHSMGVAHRDIKPENLLLDGNGVLKITDFGVSDVFRMCWEKSPHLSRGICGSEPYIAPEEFKCKEYDARRVDIWACGIVYYCMVYQGIPFRAAVPQDPNYQHFVDMRSINNYEPFEKLPPGSRKLMKRILDPNPETRITMKEILQDEWFKSIEICIHGENQDPHRH